LLGFKPLFIRKPFISAAFLELINDVAFKKEFIGSGKVEYSKLVVLSEGQLIIFDLRSAHTVLPVCLVTYLLHGAESFLRS
jgi:hypothetical protein